MEAACPTSSCSIGALPDELLLLIVSQLEMIRVPKPDRVSENDRQAYNSQILKALHSLTLTCRKLTAITAPLLYRSIVNTSHDPNTALYILRTLDLKPQFATHIQYVEYTDSEGVSPQPVTCYSDAQLNWIQDIFAGVEWSIEGMGRIYHRNKIHEHFDFWSFADHERAHIGIWYQICRMKEHNHPLLALMATMMLAPNLSEIAAPSTGALAILAFRNLKNSGLQRLCLFGDPCQYNHMVLRRSRLSQGVHDLENYLLRYLHFQFLDPFQELQVHLDDFSLSVFDADMDSIADALLLSSSLRSFSCRWRSEVSARRNPPLPPREMVLPLIWQSLLPLERTLESLTIDTLDCAWPIDMDSDISPLGSLQSFRVLKHLHVSGLVLLGDYSTEARPDIALSSVLPASLESLKIDIEWDDEIEEELYAYVSDCATSQPALTTIECSWRPAPRSIADHLIQVYKETGVDLILAIAPP